MVDPIVAKIDQSTRNTVHPHGATASQLGITVPSVGGQSELPLGDQVHPVECYGPVVRHVFARWSGSEVGLVMDRTDLEDRGSVLTLGAAYQKRLLPLAWDVLPFGGTSADRQIDLLKRVRPYLPPVKQVRVNFYGDCEFRAVPLQRTCKDWGWHWQVGLKSDVYFQSSDGLWQPLRNLNTQQGQRRYL